MMVALIVALGVGLALPAPLRSMSKDENSEWTKALAGISSGQTTTAVSETRPADKKIAKPAGGDEGFQRGKQQASQACNYQGSGEAKGTAEARSPMGSIRR